MHKTSTIETVANAGDAVPDKSPGIVNSVSSHNLTFGKEVTGNQGSRSQYFQFTLTLGGSVNEGVTEGVVEGQKYAVNLTNAYDESRPEDKTNPTYMTAVADGGGVTASADFYLKDGQYITVQGLPDGFTYNLHIDRDGYRGLYSL